MQYSQVGGESSNGGGGSDNMNMNMNDNASSRSRSTRTSFRTVSVNNHELKEPLAAANNSTADDDPFYVFREDLYRKLDLVDDGLSDYLRLVHQTDTAVNTHAVKDAKKQLKRHIRNAESTLRDVQMTISLVETQTAFHIDSNELYDRKALVSTSSDRLAHCKSDMANDTIKQKFLSDDRQKAQRRMMMQNNGNNNNNSGTSDTHNTTTMDDNNTAFIADSQAQTSLLMQQQDETLDELGDAVTRVGQMAENIQEEIGHQTTLLVEMEDDLADAEEKLGLVMGKLAKFLKTKDKWQLGTIVLLVLVALILFFLVLS